jgi:hypothetical protein
LGGCGRFSMGEDAQRRYAARPSRSINDPQPEVVFC